METYTGSENYMDFFQDFSLEDMVLFPAGCDQLWIDEASSSHEDMSFNTTEIMSSNDHHDQVFIPNTQTYQELSIFHLLKAYGESKENQLAFLGDVIQKRLSEKVNPMGTSMERVGHHLLQGSSMEVDYLREESSKNYGVALRAFYEICPYGRFAHIAANSVILESLPADVESVHIIDFDVGEGAQWPALLATLGRRISIKLTLIHCKEVEKTKENLCGFAYSIGVSLEVEEMEMEELFFDKVSGREWLVFNCMVGLPHMGVPKRRRQVLEFTRMAEQVIISSKGMGMIAYGEGCGSSFRPFSEGHLVSSHALFESMEWHFPSHLSLARTTMECLFVGPSVSLLEFMEEGDHLFYGHGLRGCRVSMQRLMEVKEMVMKGRGADDQYEVKVNGGQCENEMVLEWRGTPMVRVSAWR